jgi:PQQ-dependent catabolism-associated CXXCW motif protein
VRAAAGLALALAAAALPAAANVLDVDAVPGVRERGRETYTAFLASLPSRAFAIGQKDVYVYGWRGGESGKAAAIAGALYACNKLARNVCRVYAVDNDVVFPRYAQFEQESAKLRAEIRERDFPFGDYGDEVRELPETPTKAEGVIRTMRTVELAKIMASAVRPLLIDVAEGEPHETLPNSWWIKGAGLTGRDDPDADIRERLGLVLEGLTGNDKTARLVFYCAEARCALALHAARRARDLGYTNVSWYRGGVQAWRAARLPVLESIQSAQVR